MSTSIQFRTKLIVFSVISILTFAAPFVVNTNAMRFVIRENQELTANENEIGENLVFLPIIIVPLPNEAPTNISVSNNSIAENKPVNTEIGTFSTTDPDIGDSFTYSLVSGSGSTDNASFIISGNKLLSSIIFDYETKNSYSIRVRTTDQGGLYFEKIFIIFVTDVYEGPPVWTAMGFGTPNACLDIDVSPDDSLKLYFSTQTGVYRSSDQGVSWDLVLSGFTRKVVIDPIHPNILYSGPSAWNYVYGIYKSMDGGNTWNHYDEGMTCNNFGGLSISAVNPEILFTGSY